MTINERIKLVRKSLNLSQAAFAKNIMISNGYIAGLELGHRKVNGRIVKLICSTYGVNEAWLLKEQGDMFAGQPDFKLEQAMNAFNQLNPAFQEYVLKQIDELTKIQNTTSELE